jgi:hypothetical protein
MCAEGIPAPDGQVELTEQQIKHMDECVRDSVGVHRHLIPPDSDQRNRDDGVIVLIDPDDV